MTVHVDHYRVLLCSEWRHDLSRRRSRRSAPIRQLVSSPRENVWAEVSITVPMEVTALHIDRLIEFLMFLKAGLVEPEPKPTPEPEPVEET